MMKIFTSSQIHELDKYTIENEPISSIDLMERAARALTQAIMDTWDVETPVVVFAGPGNNGGDALAALLSGKEDFSGKLPFSYPRTISAFNCYDYRVSEVVGTMEGSYDYSADVAFQWPFRYGKSYNTYYYSKKY